MEPMKLFDGITFDDVLLLPQRSEIIPREVDLSTRFSTNIRLNIPIVSAAMDTVTESRLAIALAQEGGIGIIHKNLPADLQALEVNKVKRSASGVIKDPVTLGPHETIGTARELMDTHHISGVPIVDGARKLVGILTNRDLRFHCDDKELIDSVMTKKNLVTAAPGTTLEEAKQILHRNKVEKLLLVNPDNTLAGLITIKDINKALDFPSACKDEFGRLRVGAAVGVADEARVEKLIAAGVDVVVVDTAHGHSKNVIEAVKRYRKLFDVDIVAGNIATKEGARDLIKAGVNGVKVGIGPGSICTTRIISGVGVPQLSAIVSAVSEARDAGIPVIADGGIKFSGDITKAIAAGASTVMIGSLLAGTDEAPGETVIYRGRAFKTYRGMGSMGAMMQGSGDRYRQEGTAKEKLVPEGIEGRVPSKGALAPFLYQLTGGLRSGMGYLGAKDIGELQKKARFTRITAASLHESHPHDVTITSEAPNYRLDER